MARTDRNRLIDIRDGLDLRDRFGPDQTQRMLVEVYDGGSIPTTVPKVYLTHPVLVDADDTEGAGITATADAGTTIPVVVLGPIIPTALTRLVAHAIAGRWLAGDGGSPPVSDCYPCATCAIPQKDLTFRIGASGPTFPLIFDGTSFWSTGCQSITSTLSGDYFSCFGPQDKFLAAFSCITGNPTLGLAIGQQSTNPCSDLSRAAAMCFLCNAPTGRGLDTIDHTCAPFLFHFRSNGYVQPIGHYDCPKVTATLADTDFYVYDSSSCTDIATVNVPGCNGLPLAGASVTVKEGVTTIASGTTDASGNYSFTGGSASADVTIAATRYTTTVFSSTPLPCGATTALDMSINTVAGYECVTGCAYPLPHTLHATWTVAGAQIFTWDGLFEWVSSFSTGGHDYVVTLVKTGVVLITRDGVSCGSVTWTLGACPLSFSGTITPPAGDCLTELGIGTVTE